MKTAGGAATRVDDQGHVVFVDDHSFYFYEGEDLICQQDVGALVARIPGTDDIDESVYEPKFLLLDHLGSTRAELVFDPSTLAPQIQEYYDLMPYGEVIDPPSTQESVLFTGKQRDSESDLDFFGARYYSVLSSRWSSPDQPFTDSSIPDPQSWNLYLFVKNNPLNKTDPTGRYEISAQSEVKNQEREIENFEQARLRGLKSKDESVRNAALAYGSPGDKNGVYVAISKVVDPENKDVAGQVTSLSGTGGFTYNENSNSFQQATQVTVKQVRRVIF